MEVIKENSLGKLWWNSGNELLMDSKIFDAAKFRVGAPVVSNSGGGGAYSYDLLNFRGRERTEVIVITGGFNGTQGEMGFNIWNGQEPFGDENQKKVAEFFADHIEFKVPISAPNLGGGGGSVAFLKNGPYEFHLQGDRNLVLYDTSTTPWTVAWASGSQV